MNERTGLFQSPCDSPTRQTGSNLCVCGVRMELHEAVHNREHFTDGPKVADINWQEIMNSEQKRNDDARDAARWRALGLPDDTDPADVREWLDHTRGDLLMDAWATNHGISDGCVALARYTEENR
jgi:hypothetical protein